MDLEWTRESETKLIRLYKERPLLYDCAHSDYGTREKRSNARAEIVAELITIMPEVTEKKVQWKIRRLRDNFMTSFKHSESNGSKRSRRLWYYDEMKFLLNMHDENIVEVEIPVNQLAYNETNIKDEQPGSTNDTVDNTTHELIITTSKEQPGWTKDRMRMLLRLYKERTLLYDHNHPDFRSKSKRSQANDEIVEEMLRVMPALPRRHFLVKICELRSQYSKSIKLMKARGKTKPSLWCSNEMSFLNSFKRDLEVGQLVNAPDVQIINEAASSDEYLSDLSSMEFIDETVVSNDFVPQSNCANSSSLGMPITSAEQLCEDKKVDMSIRDNATIYVETLETPKRDDASIYAEAWAATFRKLSPEQQIFAKVEIERILMRGQLGRLTFPGN